MGDGSGKVVPLAAARSFAALVVLVVAVAGGRREGRGSTVAPLVAVAGSSALLAGEGGSNWTIGPPVLVVVVVAGGRGEVRGSAVAPIVAASSLAISAGGSGD